MTSDERLLRQMLWLRHGCPSSALYGDDGKMDCNACMLDFVNNTPTHIHDKLWELAMLRSQDAASKNANLSAALTKLKDRTATHSTATTWEPTTNIEIWHNTTTGKYHFTNEAENLDETQYDTFDDAIEGLRVYCTYYL